MLLFLVLLIPLKNFILRKICHFSITIIAHHLIGRLVVGGEQAKEREREKDWIVELTHSKQLTNTVCVRVRVYLIYFCIRMTARDQRNTLQILQRNSFVDVVFSHSFTSSLFSCCFHLLIHVCFFFYGPGYVSITSIACVFVRSLLLFFLFNLFNIVGVCMVFFSVILWYSTQSEIKSNSKNLWFFFRVSTVSFHHICGEVAVFHDLFILCGVFVFFFLCLVNSLYCLVFALLKTYLYRPKFCCVQSLIGCVW